jgi:hypothetical protein
LICQDEIASGVAALSGLLGAGHHAREAVRGWCRLRLAIDPGGGPRDDA